jgi:hypothetical protein
MMVVVRNPLSMQMIPALIAVLLAASTAAARYSGGTGDPNAPYQIATAADLIALGETPEDYDKHFVLTADIDLGQYAGTQYNIIGADQVQPFAGSFDGMGHSILGFRCQSDANRPAALFGHVGGLNAEIVGLRLVDPNVDGGDGDCIGALVGVLQSGTVYGCHVRGGTLSGRYEVGGLVGSCIEGRILSSSAACSVKGRGRVGGLLGRCDGGVVTESASHGSVVSDGLAEAVGGLVGSIGVRFPTRVVNSYSDASVNGNYCAGGLIGELLGLNATVTNCYSTGRVTGGILAGGFVGFAGNRVDYAPDVNGSCWDRLASGQTASAAGEAQTTVQMQTARMFLDAGWDFAGETANGTEDLWWIFDGRDYPRLWWERVLGDDFADGKAGPLWFVYEPEPELAHIQEAKGRLEAHTVGAGENVDAMYISDSWRLDATKGFAMRVDFHFGKQGPGDGRVTLGVGPSLNPEARQWAELEAGCFDTGPFYLYEVSDGFWVQEVVADRSADEGTLYMSYNPDTDELYFSHSGYGKANAWQTMTGLLAGRWGGKPVHVLLGIGSEGMVLTEADAWLDNFTVNVGTLVPVTPDEEGGAED